MEGRQDFCAENAQEFLLVAPDVVNVDLIEAQVNKPLQVTPVSLQVGRDEDATREMFGTNQPGDSGKIFRGTNILLGEGHTTIRPLSQGIL